MHPFIKKNSSQCYIDRWITYSEDVTSNLTHRELWRIVYIRLVKLKYFNFKSNRFELMAFTLSLLQYVHKLSIRYSQRDQFIRMMTLRHGHIIWHEMIDADSTLYVLITKKKTLRKCYRWPPKNVSVCLYTLHIIILVEKRIYPPLTSI